MNKPPAFQFYAKEWLSSSKVSSMTPAEEGAYIRLLAHAWDSGDCSLPDDDQELSIMSRLYKGWFKGASQKIRRCFKKREDGRLFNERMMKEKIKQDEWREKSKKGGEKSGESRREAKKEPEEVKGGSTTLPTKAEPEANIAVCSLQYISSNEDTPKGEVTVPKVYGDSEINEMLRLTKEVLDLPSLDGGQKSNRYAAQRWRTSLKTAFKEKNGRAPSSEDIFGMVQFVLDCVKQNDFWNGKITKIETLEKNWVQIMTSTKNSKAKAVYI